MSDVVLEFIANQKKKRKARERKRKKEKKGREKKGKNSQVREFRASGCRDSWRRLQPQAQSSTST